MAARFTQPYRELKPYWDAEAHQRLDQGRHPLAFGNLYTVDSQAVLFVGYQAHGTPGRAIQRFGPKGGWVELDGERIDIRAKVLTRRQLPTRDCKEKVAEKCSFQATGLLT